MLKLIVILAIIGGGYWYWTGPYQANKMTPLEARLEANAKTMKRCMGKEKSMSGAAGMGGIGGMSDDPEAFCARENNLVLKGGQWHDVRDDSGY
ncbi:MAG: hypothetical protein IMF06_07330 [Proteobacteria bacterium]|nr:hypothetical protein [Pseudomonadota bacterium]